MLIVTVYLREFIFHIVMGTDIVSYDLRDMLIPNTNYFYVDLNDRQNRSVQSLRLVGPRYSYLTLRPPIRFTAVVSLSTDRLIDSAVYAVRVYQFVWLKLGNRTDRPRPTERPSDHFNSVT